jgi:hypothetical protein
VFVEERVVHEIININNKKAIENSIGSSKFYKKADIEAKAGAMGNR